MKEKNLISIHAPTRGATTFRFDVYKRLRISIHAPTRGATQAIAEVLDDMGISIHAPTRGATKYPPYSDFRTVFQSTLPRGERHLRYIPVIGTRFISIHAPTRGATGFLDVPQILLDISIHAPTRGATGFLDVPQILLDISIHAPTRGATLIGTSLVRSLLFQSTLPRGERLFET